MTLVVDDVLKGYPLHEAARVTVRMLAINRLKDDPEETPETAVGWALTRATVVCHGCGVLFAPNHTVMAACDACGAPVCPSCIKVIRPGDGYLRLCPRCVLHLPGPNDPRALGRIRQRILGDIYRPRRNGRREVG